MHHNDNAMYCLVAGAVCEDKLYLVCTQMQDDMRIFDLCKKEWTALKLTMTPLVCSTLSSTHMEVACFSLEVGSFPLLASYFMHRTAAGKYASTYEA